ncbi:MAG TPA: phosphatase PAP2 family protein [Gaiellaceae bacterium]|nr:phosphatase PAP2 family protein [Gaiellaceae bacterium]
MSELAHTSRRLPRGWGHLALQLLIWLGFYAVYQVARGAADRSVYEAFQNGEWVVRTERELGALFEPALQRVVDTSSLLVTLTSYTYWLSQFAVVGITLLWVYFRRHERFAGFRNWLIAANLVGLVGYVLVPTAPPRMFPEWGFMDTLAQYSSINHDSGLIAWGSNPYAAMPSLHAMDAFIVGLVMFAVVRSRLAKALWLAWPAWVAFAVMSTGNHYWLDIVAGIAIAAATGVALRRLPALRPRRA